MKRILFNASLLIGLLSALPIFTLGQNIQLHYDFGQNIYHKALDNSRPMLTTTIEHFQPDTWGSTFFFIDMDYASIADKYYGIQSAYWEIGRDLKFWESPIALHLEYNGGVNRFVSYNNAYLIGATYSYNANDFSYGATITPSYKFISGIDQRHNAQLTLTWYWHLNNGLVSLTGFADVWGENMGKKELKKLVFLSEPQVWVNLNKIEGFPEDIKLSLGGELEMSYNFVINSIGQRFFAIPTLAAKWTF